MASSTNTFKGQVTIPVEMRRKLGLTPGDRIVFRQEGNHVILETASNVIDRLTGMFSELQKDKPVLSINQMKEVAAAGWTNEPL